MSNRWEILNFKNNLAWRLNKDRILLTKNIYNGSPQKSMKGVIAEILRIDNLLHLQLQVQKEQKWF